MHVRNSIRTAGNGVELLGDIVALGVILDGGLLSGPLSLGLKVTGRTMVIVVKICNACKQAYKAIKGERYREKCRDDLCDKCGPAR